MFTKIKPVETLHSIDQLGHFPCSINNNLGACCAPQPGCRENMATATRLAMIYTSGSHNVKILAMLNNIQMHMFGLEFL